ALAAAFWRREVAVVLQGLHLLLLTRDADIGQPGLDRIASPGSLHCMGVLQGLKLAGDAQTQGLWSRLGRALARKESLSQQSTSLSSPS
ncbi:unnamed protein product, partial [Polarella glacialis]